MMIYDVIVIGGGVAGLNAAIEARKLGAVVLLLESEKRLGGGSLQAIDDDFVINGKRLAGPEYVAALIEEAEELKVEIATLCFVTSVVKHKKFEVNYISPEGLGLARAATVILAVGANELTANDVFLQGSRPSGIFNASEAQYYLNVLGKLPTKKCVILGSENIGLNLARSLTLAGAQVAGIYERNSVIRGNEEKSYYCLTDLGIPYFLHFTITRVYGEDRVNAVAVAMLENGEAMQSSIRTIDCDAVIVAEGLRSDNYLAKKAGARIKDDMVITDQNGETTIDGLFVCGDCHIPFDLPHAIESAESAGVAAATYKEDPLFAYADIVAGDGIGKIIPSRLDLSTDHSTVTCFFTADDVYENARVTVKKGDEVLYSQVYPRLNPFRAERLCLDFAFAADRDSITFLID